MNFNIANLYPEVRFPVSATTPMIAPFIKWCHDDDWFVTSPSNTNLTSNGEIKVEKISLKVADFQYLEGHCIDGEYLKCECNMLPNLNIILFQEEFCSRQQDIYF